MADTPDTRIEPGSLHPTISGAFASDHAFDDANETEVPLDAEQELESAHTLDSLDSEELPMIVWLRGDEPWVEEFNLDAEQAMSLLGIKRSRLTQISGRELRVGRIRMDRYIRPVYRQQDIVEYLSWTRATATHMKSSNMIQEAASNLQSQSQAFADKMSTLIEAQTQRLSALTQDLNSVNVEAFSGALLAIREQLDTQSQTIALQLEPQLQRIQSQTSQLQDSMFALLGIPSEIGVMQEALRNVTEKVNTADADNKASHFQAGIFHKAIGKALTLIIEYQRNSDKTEEQLLQSILQTMQAQGGPIARRPKRRVPVAQRRRSL